MAAKNITALAVLAAFSLVSCGCVATHVDRTQPPAPPTLADKVGESVKSGVDKTAALVGIKPKPHDSNTILVSATSTDPTPDLLVSIAEMHMQAGRLGEAEKQYERALKEKPSYLPALLGYAHLNDQRGDFEAATKLYQKAITAYPKDAAAYNDLGLNFQKRKMTADALKMLKQAVHLEPQKKLYRNNLAALLVEMGRIDEALVQLKAVHGESIAHYNVGYLLVQKGDQRNALSQFQRARQLDPSLAAAQEWIVKLSPPNGPAGARPNGPPPGAAPANAAIQALPGVARADVNAEAAPARRSPPTRLVSQTRPVASAEETITPLPPPEPAAQAPVAQSGGPMQSSRARTDLALPPPNPAPQPLVGSASHDRSEPTAASYSILRLPPTSETEPSSVRDAVAPSPENTVK